MTGGEDHINSRAMGDSGLFTSRGEAGKEEGFEKGKGLKYAK